MLRFGDIYLITLYFYSEQKAVVKFCVDDLDSTVAVYNSKLISIWRWS